MSDLLLAWHETLATFPQFQILSFDWDERACVPRCVIWQDSAGTQYETYTIATHVVWELTLQTRRAWVVDRGYAYGPVLTETAIRAAPNQRSNEVDLIHYYVTVAFGNAAYRVQHSL